MKKTVISFLFLLTAFGLSANPVNRDEARMAAQNYWKIENGYYPDFEDAEFEFSNMYLFLLANNDNDGFIIIAADDRSVPVLGYSLGNQFITKSMPRNVYAWLKDYERQIDFLVKNDIEPTAETRNEWTMLRGGITAPRQTASVSPLLETEWSQDPYYNDKCPEGTWDKCPAGCTATATAQVMNYWQHPATGVGSHSYSWNGRTLSANFGNTTYDWNNMPNSLDYYSTSTEVNAVSTLIYHVGVACDMDYGDDGSGAEVVSYGDGSIACAENALIKYFRYSSSLHGLHYSSCTDAEWKAKLKNELDNSRPVIYAGYDTKSGHCFVFDGYNSYGKFHINWGWGGYCDAYYAIGQLNPSSGGTGSSSSNTYNIDNKAIFGIQPATSTSPSTTTITVAANNTAYGSASGAGTFNNSTTQTSQILASSNEGYRFVDWNTGSRYNPFSAIHNGEAQSFTANFAPVTGDTLYYCELGNISALRTSETNTPFWGIRFPVSSLTAGKMLYKVQLYVYYTGTYTLHVYSGGTTAPVLEEYQESFSITDGGWNTLRLSNTYPIDETKPLWIVFSYTGTRDTYPMSITQYAGNIDSFWASEDGGNSWKSYQNDGDYYSWNIRAITRDIDENAFLLTTDASPATYGITTPGRAVAFLGDDVTMTALANPAYRFDSWTDGVIENPRTVTVTQDKSYTARFAGLGIDTMTYCPTSDYVGAIGISSSDNNLYWAVKFEPEALAKKRKLTKIKYFDAVNGSVTLRVYVGGTVKPLTSKYQVKLSCNESMKWKECTISSELNISNDKPLWIVFSAPANTYPAAYTVYSGNNNGCYVSTDGNSWESLTESSIYGSFMVKAVTEPSSGTSLDETECQPMLVTSADGRIIVEIAGDAERISIYDAAGRCVADKVQNTPMQCYDIHAPGVYMVRSSSGTTAKVVVR